ncbi:MAG: DUF763 domain-containing protein [Deltaproteobacteria bacterium]|nr:DUF763 domain-containing protein [Deltaproteobacteria bacterium]
MRRGIAHLPLHYGKTPPWLFKRMTLLAREITRVLVAEFGPEEVLRRLSNPFWFQAFGCLLGFDWHSSGLTTTVCGALKEGLRGLEQETEIFVAGGKGRTSRDTPQEIERHCDRISLEPSCLIYASRMSAKVDSSALQDGYQLYHHTFLFTLQGEWCVIQQGMNPATRYARRYHWLEEGVKNFVCEPHQAICCDARGAVLNMVAQESQGARGAVAALSMEDPDRVFAEVRRIERLDLPSHHPIQFGDLNAKRLYQVFIKTYERGTKNFEEVLGTPGVGPKTIRALSLIAELIYGEQPSFRDPARFSFAHGGKDGHPYPVDRETYDRSIDFLKRGLWAAKVGRSEKLKAMRRLNAFFSPQVGRDGTVR